MTFHLQHTVGTNSIFKNTGHATLDQFQGNDWRDFVKHYMRSWKEFMEQASTFGRGKTFLESQKSKYLPIYNVSTALIENVHTLTT